MWCAEARQRLFDPEGTRSPELVAHFETCAACAALLARLEAAQRGLRAHLSEHTPDPAFSARVIQRLPDTAAVLGWAALRLLPAGLVLALLCSWYGATRGPGLSDLLSQPEDPRLLTYVALGGEPSEDPANGGASVPAAHSQEGAR
jgi:anti-sigma factor RsiW